MTGQLAANVRAIGALGRRSVRQALRRPQYLAPILLFPSMMLAVNTGGAGRATELPDFPEVHGFLDFELAGAMTQSTMLGGLAGGIALAMDIEAGFIDRLIAAPVARSAIVLGRLLGTAVLGMLSGLWFVAVGLVFGARIEGGVLGAGLIVGASAAAAVAFGAVAAAIALASGRTSVVQGFFPIVFVVIFLSSAFFPRELLLEPANTIADYNPLSLIAEGLREPIIAGVSAEMAWKTAVGVGSVGLFGAAASALALRARLRAR